jgi:conjugative transfer region protein TrbK
VTVDARTVLRSIAVTLLVGGVPACAAETGHMAQGIEPSRSLMQEHGDLLTAELQRCKALGEEGLHDAACKAAWARNRERFLAPLQKQTSDPFQVVPERPSTKLPSEIFPERAPSKLWPDSNQTRPQDR